MMMGPEPRIRIFEMSVRFGIMQSYFCVDPACYGRLQRGGGFERARLQARRLTQLWSRALAPEVSGPIRVRRVPTSTEILLLVGTDTYGPDSSEYRKCVADSLRYREFDDPKSLFARPPYLSRVPSLRDRRTRP